MRPRETAPHGLDSPQIAFFSMDEVERYEFRSNLANEKIDTILKYGLSFCAVERRPIALSDLHLWHILIVPTGDLHTMLHPAYYNGYAIKRQSRAHTQRTGQPSHRERWAIYLTFRCLILLTNFQPPGTRVN